MTMPMNSRKIAVAAIVLITTFLAGKVQAQGHTKMAPNCVYAKDYYASLPKNSKSPYVSCIDCYCKACGEKQAKEREQRQREEKLAIEKRTQEAEKRRQEQVKNTQEQKKQLALQRQKSKDNQVVLVAPKSKVSNTVTEVYNLSAQDREIMQTNKSQAIEVSFLSGKTFWNNAWTEFSQPVIKIHYSDKSRNTHVLRDNFNVQSKLAYTSCSGRQEYPGYNNPRGLHGLSETGYLKLRFSNEKTNAAWEDLVDLSGKSLLNDIYISEIKYIGDNFYLLTRTNPNDTRAGRRYEMYNIQQRKTYPFPDETISDYTLNYYLMEKGGYYGHNGNYDSRVALNVQEGKITGFREGKAANLIHTWILKDMKKAGISFYDKEMAITRKSNVDRISTTSSSYEENKDNCLAMFMIFRSDNQKVNEILIYGFDPGKGAFISFDKFSPTYKIKVDNQYDVFTLWKYWFGVTTEGNR